MAILKRITETPKRIYAIGDIHGCADELDAMLRFLVSEAGLNDHDLLIFIGDYVDRGPASRAVIDRLIEFNAEHPWSVFLKGNHEDMLLNFLGYPGRMGPAYLANGGINTLESYGCVEPLPGEGTRSYFPEQHLRFLNEQLTDYLEVPGLIFAHAGLGPLTPLESQREEELFWIRDEFIMNVHHFERTVVFGHTPYHDIMFHLPFKIGIDTGLVYGNKLSCIELAHQHVFQIARGSKNVVSGSFLERLKAPAESARKDKPLKKRRRILRK